VKESYHFHPVLFYFRFDQPFYGVSRSALVTLDTATLIKTALDPQEYGWLQESAAVDQLERGTLMELKTLAHTFLHESDLGKPPDEQTRARWRRRFEAARERIRRAGIKTNEAGAEEYVSLRGEWDKYTAGLAPRFGYELNEVDTALAKV
jgi:hypothetical protein